MTDHDQKLEQFGEEMYFPPIDTSAFRIPKKRKVPIKPILSLLGFIMKKQQEGNVSDFDMLKQEYEQYRVQKVKEIRRFIEPLICQDCHDPIWPDQRRSTDGQVFFHEECNEQ